MLVTAVRIHLWSLSLYTTPGQPRTIVSATLNVNIHLISSNFVLPRGVTNTITADKSGGKIPTVPTSIVFAAPISIHIDQVLNVIIAAQIPTPIRFIIGNQDAVEFGEATWYICVLLRR